MVVQCIVDYTCFTFTRNTNCRKRKRCSLYCQLYDLCFASSRKSEVYEKTRLYIVLSVICVYRLQRKLNIGKSKTEVKLSVQTKMG